jgi:hypothetical protein
MLTTKVGLAFEQHYFAEKSQAMTGLEFHDMRGTRAIMLAAACCTLPGIVAMTGRRLRRDMPQMLDAHEQVGRECDR